MSSLLGALSIILDKHYELFTSIIGCLYKVVVVLSSICQTLQEAVLLVHNATATLLADTVNILRVCGLVLAQIFIQALNVIHMAFTILDTVVLTVYDNARWFGSGVISAVDILLEVLCYTISLPHRVVTLIDNHLLWCYREISGVLCEAGRKIITVFSDVLYHTLLTPYYAANYIISALTSLIKLSIRFAECATIISHESSVHMKEFLEDSLAQLSQMVNDVVEVYSSAILRSVAYCCLMSVKLDDQLMKMTHSIYFHNATLIFGDYATFKDILSAILILPFQLVAVAVRDLSSYNTRSTLALLKLVAEDFPLDVDVYIPLPDIEKSVYCVCEEILWLVWLNVKVNWSQLLIICVLCITAYLVITNQRLVAQRILQYGQRTGTDQPIAILDDEDVIEISDSESDDDEPIIVQLPQTRSQRLARSRSSTPDLSTPGAETRYIRKLRLSLDEERNNRLCTVCQENCRNILLLPCRHLCVCNDCAQEILRRRPSACPLCRARINQAMDVYV